MVPALPASHRTAIPFGTMSSPLSVQVVLDEDWAEMMADFQKAKKPSKWKFKMLMETGEISVVKHDKGKFLKSYRGQQVALVSMSMARELEEAKRFTEYRGARPSETPGTFEEFETRLEGRLTGNHQPHTHTVRVPTAPGQPVRG